MYSSIQQIYRVCLYVCVGLLGMYEGAWKPIYVYISFRTGVYTYRVFESLPCT